MERSRKEWGIEDEERKESIEAKNIAESTVYEIEKNLTTYKDDINESEKSEIDSLIAYVFLLSFRFLIYSSSSWF